MTDIVLDGVTYTDLGLNNGVRSFQDRSSGVVTGFSTITERVNYTKDKVNVLSKLYLPEITGDDSACACYGDVVSEVYVDINVRYDKKTTAPNRTFIRKALQAWVNTAQFIELVENLNPASN